MEFYPLELAGELSEDFLGEAFLQYSIDAGVRHVHSGAPTTGALQRSMYRIDAARSLHPHMAREWGVHVPRPPLKCHDSIAPSPG